MVYSSLKTLKPHLPGIWEFSIINGLQWPCGACLGGHRHSVYFDDAPSSLDPRVSAGGFIGCHKGHFKGSIGGYCKGSRVLGSGLQVRV